MNEPTLSLTISRYIRLIPVIALSLGTIGPAYSQGGMAGPYLAARVANKTGDFAAAVEYGIRALARDPQNMQLMKGLLVAQIGLGKFDQAVPVARRLHGLDANSQMANLVLLVDRIKAEDWDGALALHNDGARIGGIVDDLVQGWAYIGKGQIAEAKASFDEMAQSGQSRQVAIYHKALALALAEDYQGAADILSGETGGNLSLQRSGVLAYVQVLSQLERNPDAVDLIDKAFPRGGDPAIRNLRAELAAGKPIPFDMVTSPRDALSQVVTQTAQSLSQGADPNVALLYSRASEYLNPDRTLATFLSASLLEELKLHELAVETYSTIPQNDPQYFLATLARAEVLRQMDQTDEAIDVLINLAAANPKRPRVFQILGDTYRLQKRFEEAAEAYDNAIALFQRPAQSQWSLYFSRGISRERTGRWNQAEADFRKALELNPEQPTVLNYLGYSFVEQGENLDEALDMIKRAVAARPDDGYITDSLGWVYYRLGRYEEAVIEMERAVELKPVDPVVNDHLGDVYWAVGRHREAEFQWRRALSFITEDDDPEEVRPDRMRRKLDVGLDVVLEEEGAEPLLSTDGDG
ncbi:MAG TPA: tetratricopeptide repeat protein [Aliiroseovarius sp.]|nr:tetratricopeptide repeat protein [Aliiroseovarius sp.]